MKQYLDLLRDVLEHGVKKEDRTGVGTLSVFGRQTRYDLSEGFPLVTTKKVYLRAIIHELLWFIKGDTNIKYLVDNNVRIWNEWPYDRYKKSPEFKGETIDEFIEKIRTDNDFAIKYGDLGPVYGKEWRNYPGAQGINVDQLKNVIDDIKKTPDSRRLIVCAWNPALIDQMALPPCHSLFQFYVADGKLSCMLYQRSADLFLGVPFNIASYALLTMIIADVCHLELGEFIHTTADTHIYTNHIEQVKLQLSRTPHKLPNMIIKNHHDNIEDYVFEDFELVNYECDEAIKAEVAV